MAPWHASSSPLQWGVVIGASLVAAWFDLRRRRIPNLLTGPLLLAGLLRAGCVRGLPGLADACAGCALLTLPYLALFVFAGGGAGDAKFMGGVGAWLGWGDGLAALAAVMLSGVVLSVGLSLARRRFRLFAGNLASIVLGAALLLAGRRGLAELAVLRPDGSRMQRIPYATAALAGLCLAAGGTWLCRGR